MTSRKKKNNCFMKYKSSSLFLPACLYLTGIHCFLGKLQGFTQNKEQLFLLTVLSGASNWEYLGSGPLGKGQQDSKVLFLSALSNPQGVRIYHYTGLMLEPLNFFFQELWSMYKYRLNILLHAEKLGFCFCHRHSNTVIRE